MVSETEARANERLKAVVSKRALYNALTRVRRALFLAAKPEILQCVLIEADFGALTLTCSDPTMRISVSIEANVIQPGFACVKWQSIYKVIAHVPDEDVQLEAGPDHALHLRWGNSQYQFYGWPPSQFPKRREPEPGFLLVTVGAGDLKRLARLTYHAVDKLEWRPHLTGVHALIKGNRLRFEATDGVQIAWAEATVQDAQPDGSVDGIVPQRAIRALADFLPSKGDNPATVTLTQERAFFCTAEFTITTELLKGVFPQFETLLPDRFGTSCRADSLQILAAMRRLSPVGGESTWFSISDGEIVCRVKSPEVLQAEERIPCTFVGLPLGIMFNCDRVLQVLKPWPAREVQMDFPDGKSPARILPAGDDSYGAWLLPLITYGREPQS